MVTPTSGDFGAISVTERSTPICKVESYLCATLWRSFSIIHVNVKKIKNYVERKNRLCYTRKTSLATPN